MLVVLYGKRSKECEKLSELSFETLTSKISKMSSSLSLNQTVKQHCEMSCVLHTPHCPYKNIRHKNQNSVANLCVLIASFITRLNLVSSVLPAAPPFPLSPHLPVPLSLPPAPTLPVIFGEETGSFVLQLPSLGFSGHIFCGIRSNKIRIRCSHQYY